MGHHLHVNIVFHVVALNDRNLPVYDHEFRMQGAKQRLVEIHDFKVEIRYLLWLWQLNSFPSSVNICNPWVSTDDCRVGSPCVDLGFDVLARIGEICSASFIIHDLYYYACIPTASTNGQFSQSITDELGTHRRRPRTRDQDDFSFGSHYEIGHVTDDVGQRSNHGQRYSTIAAQKWWGYHTAERIRVQRS